MKNWVKRAVRTFFQSFVSYMAVALPAVDWQSDRDVLRGTLIGIGVSSLAAGISAVMNYIDDNKLL